MLQVQGNKAESGNSALYYVIHIIVVFFDILVGQTDLHKCYLSKFFLVSIFILRLLVSKSCSYRKTEFSYFALLLSLQK